MTPGDLVADRFEIQALAGVGGMCAVYRAVDQTTREVVALKIPHEAQAAHQSALLREGELLGPLKQAGTVRVVASGALKDGRPYLALEWISGEDLAARIKRERLSFGEALLLLRKLGSALGGLHKAGIIHLDLKPANVLLRDGQLEAPTLVDFGNARAFRHAVENTGSGDKENVGTPGYMAPEHIARNAPLGPPADVFALGCVLFRALTGRRAFEAKDPAAVMAKTLLEEAPRLSSVLEDVPEALDELLAQMLAKQPELRPKDGDTLVALAEALDLRASVVAVRRQAALTESEQRLVGVVVTLPVERGLSAATPDAAGPELSGDEAQVRWTARLSAELTRKLSTAAEHYGAKLQWMVDGTVLVSLSDVGPATDLAARIARCALELRELVGDGPVAVATGRAVISQTAPLGEVIDRAIALVRTPRPLARPVAKKNVPLRGVRVDPDTQGLLGPGFELGKDEHSPLLWAWRERAEAARALVGNKTLPFRGRDRELETLLELCEDCTRSKRPRILIVVGADGVGKSRLREEFTRALAVKGAVEAWFGRGDPVRVGAPYALLGSALRAGIGLKESDALALRQQRVLVRVRRGFKDRLEAARVAEFLGEMIGTPFSDVHSPKLRAARADASVRTDQMRQAWEDWLRAESGMRPIVIVLDDLQCIDRPSLEFLEGAMDRVGERPWLIVGFARESVFDSHAEMFQRHEPGMLELKPLARDVCVGLAREVLGPAVASARVEALADRAQGNAFLLEELLRAEAAGGDGALPSTVLAMVQARIERMDAEGRRILRAASVFGETFWRGGVKTLLGGSEPRGGLDAWLRALTEEGLVTKADTSCYRAEQEYSFANGAIRAAAYAMLTPTDARLGHRLAAEWLEAQKEQEPAVLSAHYERSDEASRAAKWLLRAAERALDGNDLRAAGETAARGIACGAQGELKGALRSVQVECERWRGRFQEALEFAREATSLLPKGSVAWFRAVQEEAIVASVLNSHTRLHEAADLLVSMDSSTAARAAHIHALARTAQRLIQLEDQARVEALLGRIDALMTPALANDPILRARVLQTRATLALQTADDGAHLSLARSALAEFERAGALRAAATARVEVAVAWSAVGQWERAQALLEETRSAAQRDGLVLVELLALCNASLVVARLGQRVQGLRFAEEAVGGYEALRDRRMTGAARVYWAWLLLEDGKLEEAALQAEKATGELEGFGGLSLQALALKASVAVKAEKKPEALELAEALDAALRESSGSFEHEAKVWLSAVEAMELGGSKARAEKLLETGATRLLARLERLQELELRTSAERDVPEHRRLLEKYRTVQG